MPEIKFSEFDSYLGQIKEKGPFLPVYLFHGDEYLYKKKLESLIEAILPGKKRKHNYESMDGQSGSIYDLIESLSTYSLFSGLKVVSLTDSRIFYSKQDKLKLLENAREKAEADDAKASSGKLLQFLSLSSLSLEDVLTPDSRKKAFSGKEQDISDGWIDTVISYCSENKLTVPAYTDESTLLQKALEKGFPKKHHLIITTDLADKRRVLYKLIREKGLVVDCTVPKGERKADNDIKLQVFRAASKDILEKHGKKMEPAAFDAVIKMAGFELRTVTGNIEKLIHFIGQRDKITLQDVSSVLKRTKKDPIYELTEAVSNRNLPTSLFYLSSLLSDGEFHPLQILSALINQVRKLIVAKDFVISPYGQGVHSGMQFNQFKTTVLKNIIEFDKNVSETGADMDEGSGKKKSSSSELSIVKNPNNPYPVFQLLLKAEKFSMDELYASYECLYDADMQLKSSGNDPRLLLEKAIIDICRPG